MVCDVRRRRFAQGESLVAKPGDQCVDDIEHRLRGAKARGNRQVAELPRPALEQVEHVFATRELLGTAPEMLAGLDEPAWVGPLEPIDRLLEVTDHEKSAVPVFALA